MVRYSIRKWINLATTGPRVRSSKPAHSSIERLEDRLVLSPYSVASTLDSVDANPGDGVAVDANGNATLRAAVIDANALAGADTIMLGAGVFAMSLSGRGENAAAAGDLDVIGNLTIEGAGANQTILDAALLDRFFHVQAGSTLTLRNVTIRSGREGSGGAILNDGVLVVENVEFTGNAATTRGGAIYNNAGRVTLQSVNIFGNESRDVISGGGSSIGGGLASFGGTVTILTSQFANNTAAADGGAIDARSTTLNVSNSSFHDNSANVGGAVRLFNGTANFTSNTFDGDHAVASGGAIASNICALTITGGSFTGNYISSVPPSGAARTGGSLYLVGINSSSPAVTITGVTFQQTGSGDGGGIYNSNARINLSNSTFDRVTGRQGGSIWNSAGGMIAMVNTTIYGGTAIAGGAIFNNGQMQMTNCTVSGNTSTGQSLSVSGAVSNSGTLTAMNNLIANNVGGFDVSGNFVSLGGNLIGQGDGSSGFSDPTDFVGTVVAPIDPLLSPLADNGGSVKTMAVSARSLARDGGVSGGPLADARGMPRTADNLDIGAFEYQNHLPVAGPFDVSTDEDEVLTGNLIASDADEDILTYQLLVPPTDGFISLDPDGRFTYTPLGNATGAVGFRYRVTDGRGFSNDVNGQIVLRPVNDSPTVSDQSFGIEENSPDGTYIGTVIATDIDGDSISGEIISGNESGTFNLDGETGALFIADGSLLNFETTPSLSFVIRITDNGSPSLSSLATIAIYLTDINDAPQLDSATFTIDENSVNDTIVGTATATDADVGQSLAFDIVSSSPAGAFAINAATGTITVADGSLLNFENHASLSLLIRVTDSGTPALAGYSVVTIDLNDVNETLPIAIDVAPGDLTNTLRLGKRSDIAILSTAMFDARLVNVKTVRFGKLGTEDSVMWNLHGPIGFNYRDVNHDGRVDLVIQIAVSDTGLQIGDTLGRLTGMTRKGQAFVGTSSIVVQRENPRCFR